MKITEILTQILESLKDKKAANDRLWDISDIAYYVGYNNNFVSSLKNNPNFPRPIVLGKHPRWEPNEVRDFCKKQRG